MQSNITLKKPGSFFSKLSRLLAVLFLFTGTVTAQTYTNGNLGTGATSLSGVAAPAGSTWHELQNVTGNTTESNATLGLSHYSQGTANFSMADDFIVPAGQTWNLTNFRVYSLDQVTTTNVSPYTNIRIRIYNGVPGAGGTVIFGDLTTNRFSGTGYTAKRGIFNSQVPTPTTTPTPNLPIFYIDANVNTSLPAGTYWIEWQVVTAAAAFTPTSQTVGVRTMPGYNARQSNAGVWSAAIDGGNPASAPDVAIDIPFSINYTTVCVQPTAPTVVANNASVCANTPVTLTVTGGSLGNAANWVWYAGGCGTGAPVGTGTTITVTPTATTTYYARGEGGSCVTVPGPCGSVTVATTPCTCLSPDAATICQGSIQQLSLTVSNPIPTMTFTSATAIAIPSVGNATPYPSTITVSGLPTTGVRVKSITLGNVTHTFPSDIDAAVVSPTNVPVIIMSDVAGTSTITNRTYTFSDAAAATLPNATSPAGTYKPSNPDAPDNFPAPGPGNLSQINPTLATFGSGNVNMNGTWNLYVVDDAGGDLGSMSGWNIVFEILPTATWSGGPAGTIFSDAAATIPYVAGTPATTVYVKPQATATYTATVASGSCAGANNVTVTVLPRPVVTLSPTTGCGPLTITASGASTYVFSPGTGLNNTTGPIVIANPTATTTYTVVGTGTNGCTSAPVTATVNTAPTASVLSSVASATFQINEGFTTVPPTGWALKNNSVPLGTTPPFNTWTQGDATLFTAFNGPTNSYALANFQATTGTGTISNWLFTPALNIKNGDIFSFYTRTVTGAAFPDRMEVRMNTTNNGTNVGTTATSVGDFTTLIFTINPNLVTGPGTGTGTSGYPDTWTKFTYTVSGITGTIPGRIAFRHFVTNGGPTGANSDNVGVDQVEYSTPASATCANTVSNLAINITGGVGPYTVVYSNGTTNTTVTNYNSGGPIQVSPPVSTTYTIVSVTGANGCTGTGNSGTVAINVTPPATITTAPAAQSACIGGNATFGVTPNTTNGTTYQYQVSTDGGVTYTNIPGATTQNYTLTGATAAMNGNLYRVIVTGACGGVITSAGVPLTVNAPATILAQPGATTIACAGNNATITVLASGNQLTYQWQVSTNGGTTFTNVANGANYSGATTNMLTIINVPTTFLNYQYRVLVSSGGCAAITSAVSTLTTINAAPVTVISVAPSNTVQPGTTVVLTAATSPATGTTYQWYRNGVPVAGATGNTLTVGVDGIGTYTVVATTANGCFSSASTPVNITIGTSASTVLFIYPSPNSGTFQVRYYNKTATALAPEGALLNVFDSKGSRVFTQQYGIIGGYTQMNVNLGSHGSGIYRVELSNSKGERIKTGSVLVY